MNDKKLLKALAEGLISYAFYLLMTTPRSDLVVVRVKMYRAIAHSAQRLAGFFGALGINAERHADDILM